MQFAVDNPYAAPLNGIFIPHSYKPSLINEILKRPDVQLQELLNEPDFIDELKNGNTGILDYFTRNPHQTKTLVEYIIQVAPDLNDNKRAYEYPLLAYEIFEVDTGFILDSFFVSNSASRNTNLPEDVSARKLSKDNLNNNETVFSNQARQEAESNESTEQLRADPNDRANTRNEDLLSYLFSFLNTKEELNPVLAGYFNRLVHKLVQRNQRKVIEFAYKNEQVLFGLIDHIGQHSISELIPMFLCSESDNGSNSDSLKLRLQIIDKILNTLGNVNKPEEMTHVAEIVSELLHRNENTASGKEIVNRILCKETFDRIFGILNCNISNNSMTHIGNVILTLLGHFTAKKSNQYSPRGTFALYLQRGYDDDPITFSICENLEKLNKILVNDSGNTLYTTYGQTTGRLGLGKLKVVDIIEKIVRIDSKKIYRKINETGILQTLTEMFAKFMWNNILHVSYERLIYTIIDKRDSALMEALFDKADFVGYVVREIKEDQFGFPKSQRKIRKGNMGFIVKIANELARVGSFERTLEDQLKKNSDWESIVLPSLKARNELDNKEMGGYHPRNMSFGMTDSLLGYTQFNSGLGGYYTAANFSYSPPQDIQPQISTPSYVVQSVPVINSSPPQDQKVVELNSLPSYTSKFNESYGPEKTGLLELPKITSEFNIQQPSYTSTRQVTLDEKNTGNDIDQSLRNVVIEQPHLTHYEPNKTAAVNDDITPKEDLFKKKDAVEISDIVAKQLKSSTDILNRLKMELNISPTRDTKHKEFKELDDDPVIMGSRKRFESYNPSPVSKSLDGNMLRKSMIEMKSGKKVKLRVKKAEKLDGSKILDMINKFKGPNSMTSSMELSCSENSHSESGNLAEDSIHPGQEVMAGQLSDTASIMAQLLALREKELA